METIQIADFQENFYDIINSVTHSHKQIMITDKGKLLVKISPISTSEKDSWLGCMNGTGKIIGDIVSPAESPETWEILSE